MLLTFILSIFDPTLFFIKIKSLTVNVFVKFNLDVVIVVILVALLYVEELIRNTAKGT